MSNMTKKEPANLVKVPEYLKHQGAPQGIETMTGDDMAMPRIAICQANTPQRKKAELSYIEGLDEGLIFNTVTGEIYGHELTGVPLFFFKQRMKFTPIADGGGLECQSLNGVDGGRLHPSDCASCPHAQFNNDDPEDSRPACNLLLNYMILLPHSQLAAFSLKSTGLKAARQLNAQIRMSGLDMFARTLTITSVSMTRKNNQFWGPKLTLGDFVPEDLYNKAKQFFLDLRGKNINLDMKGLDDEGSVGDASTEPGISDKDIPF